MSSAAGCGEGRGEGGVWGGEERREGGVWGGEGRGEGGVLSRTIEHLWYTH